MATSVEIEGWEVEIRRAGYGPNGVRLYEWHKDRPSHRRASVKYLQSHDNQKFSVNIACNPASVEDASVHWQLEIQLGGIAVYREKITAKQVTEGWSRNIMKSSCGPKKGPFVFDRVERPDDPRPEDIRSGGTLQDTISVRFYHLKIEGIVRPRVRQVATRDDHMTFESPKILLENPELAFAHRPSVRDESRSKAEAKQKEDKYKYRQEEEASNPYYCFDFKLRNWDQLRELNLVPQSHEGFARRAVAVHQSKQEIQARKRALEIRSDTEDGDSDDCRILDWQEKPVSAPVNPKKRSRGKTNNQRGLKRGRGNRATGSSRGAQANAAKKRNAREEIAGSSAQSPLFVPRDSTEDHEWKERLDERLRRGDYLANMRASQAAHNTRAQTIDEDEQAGDVQYHGESRIVHPIDDDMDEPSQGQSRDTAITVDTDDDERVVETVEAGKEKDVSFNNERHSGTTGGGIDRPANDDHRSQLSEGLNNFVQGRKRRVSSIDPGSPLVKPVNKNMKSSKKLSAEKGRGKAL